MRLDSTLTLVLVLIPLTALVACGGGERRGSSPTSPSPTTSNPVLPVTPHTTPAGLDTEWKQFVDGTGKSWPARMRLLFIYPAPSTQIPLELQRRYDNNWGGHFRAEICMETTSNPINTQFLTKIRVWPMWSRDGVAPVARGPGDIGMPVFDVANGMCVTWTRIPVDVGGTEGQQWFIMLPNIRYLVFAANIGPNIVNWNDTACPTPEALGTQRNLGPPQCTLRTVAYDLNYQW